MNEGWRGVGEVRGMEWLRGACGVVGWWDGRVVLFLNILDKAREK